MTLDPSGWIPNVLGSLEVQASGVPIKIARPALNLLGATATDNAANNRTDITLPSGGGGGYSTAMNTWLSTPTSANFLAAMSDETGTGLLVFGTSPTIKTSLRLRNPADTFDFIFTPSAIAADRTITVPLLGANDTLVCEAFAQTLTNKTLDAANNSLTVTSGAAGDLLVHNGTKFVRLPKGAALQVLRVNAGATGLEFVANSAFTTPTGTGLVTVTGGVLNAASTALGTNVPTFLTTPSSANLAAAITDETGTGSLVFATSPTFRTGILLNNPANTFAYTFTPAAITAARTITLPLLAANDTMVTAAFAQTLTNKTIDSSAAGITAGFFNLSARQAVTGTGTITDLALTATTSYVAFTGAGAVDLTTIVAPTTTRTIYISNQTGNVLTLKELTGATAANQISCKSSTDTLINNRGGAILVYDLTLAKWVCVAVNA
jgi:hypothetical protein